MPDETSDGACIPPSRAIFRPKNRMRKSWTAWTPLSSRRCCRPSLTPKRKRSLREDSPGPNELKCLRRRQVRSNQNSPRFSTRTAILRLKSGVGVETANQKHRHRLRQPPRGQRHRLMPINAGYSRNFKKAGISNRQNRNFTRLQNRVRRFCLAVPSQLSPCPRENRGRQPITPCREQAVRSRQILFLRRNL